MQHASQIRVLVNTADALGADLPAKVKAHAEHTQAIGQQVREHCTTERDVVDVLAVHLGDPGALSKALPAALDALVRTKHAGLLADQLEAKATALTMQAIAADAEAVAAAFAAAVQPHLDVLNTHAATVPAWVSPTMLEELSAVQFEAWKKCSAAAEVIEQALAAVAPLYRRGNEDTFTIEALRHSVVAEVPDTMTYDQAWKWVHAISGRVGIGENNPLGQLRVDDTGCWFAQVAALGGSFRWATTTERRARLDRLRAGTVRPVIERSGALA